MWSVHRMLLIALLVLTACRVVIIGTSGLSPAETHLAAMPIAWNHAPNGPAPALIAAVSRALAGDSAWVLRALMPWFALGASLLLYRLARGLWDSNTAAWSVAALNVLPWFNIAAVTFSPLAPLLFFSLLFLWLLWLALHRATKVARMWAAAALAHLAACLFAPSFAITLAGLLLLPVLIRRRRALLTSLGPWCFLLVWTTGAVATATLAPHFHLGAAHEWRTLSPAADTLIRLTLWCSPLVLPAIVWAYLGGVLRLQRHITSGFLLAFAFPAILAALAGLGPTLPEHPTPSEAFAVTVGLVLLVSLVHDLEWPAARRAALRTILLGSAAVSTFVLFNADLLHSAGLRPHHALDARADTRGWHTTLAELERAAATIQSESGRAPLLVTDCPRLAVQLDRLARRSASTAFHQTGDTPFARPYPSPRRHHAFAYRQGIASAPPPLGTPILFVSLNPGTAPPPLLGPNPTPLLLTEVHCQNRPLRTLSAHFLPSWPGPLL